MNRIIRCCSCPPALFLFAALLFAAAALARPCSVQAMAVVTLPASERTAASGASGEVTIWYPSKAAETVRTMGPFSLSAAWNGAPVRGNGALIVLSHGSGGSAFTYWDLARVFVEAGFVVAAPEHDGDNWRDQAKTGPASWKQRPDEISSAIDRVEGEPRFLSLLEKGRVGVFGMSAGGLTALEFSGATWSLARLVKHCADHFEEDIGFCAYREATIGGAKLDGATRERLKSSYVEGARSGMVDAKEYGHEDKRVKATVAAVPAAAVIDPASLRKPGAPAALIPADLDRVLAPQWHVFAIEKACPTCAVLGPLRGGGHLSILSPMPEAVARSLGPWALDPPGFDRASLAPLYQDIARFFSQHI